MEVHALVSLVTKPTDKETRRMQIHSNAATLQKQRQAIQTGNGTYREIAQEWRISVSTAYRWKHRSDTGDRSCRPHTIEYALSDEEQRAVLCLRRFRMSLDDIVDALEDVIPHLCRTNTYRLLVRAGVNRLPKTIRDAEPGSFKAYEPGYLHIDSFMLPGFDGTKRHCYVSVDRATRLVFLRVYKRRTLHSALDFLRQCSMFYPFRIRKVLTDNGKEYAYSYGYSAKGRRITKTHEFEQLCASLGIEHRRTRPYTPKTNGMVERMIGRIQQDTVYQFRYRSSAEMLDSLRNWLIQYNFHRKNRRIGRITPYEATSRWLIKDPESQVNETSDMLRLCSQRCGT